MKKRRSKKHRAAQATPPSAGGKGGLVLASSTRDPGKPIALAPSVAAESSKRTKLDFDLWRLAGAVLHGWPRLLAGGLALGLAGFFYGSRTAEHTAQVKLIHNQSPGWLNAGLASETFRPREPATDTFVEAMRSLEIMRRAPVQTAAPLTPAEVQRRFEISPVVKGEFLALKFRDRDPKQAVRLVNFLAEEAVRVSRELQTDEFKELGSSLQKRLAALDVELSRTSRELIEFQRAHGSIDYDEETSITLKRQEEWDVKAQDVHLQLETQDLQLTSLAHEIARQYPVLMAAKTALAKALERYTDEHPKVLQLRAAVAAAEAEVKAREGELEADVASWGSPVANGLYQQVVELRTKRIALNRQLRDIEAAKAKLQQTLAALPEKQLACARIKSQYQSLKAQRDRLVQYERDCQLLADNSVGYYRAFQSASVADVDRWVQARAGLLMAVCGGLLGMLAAGVVLIGRELADGRIRSETELQRITKLPLLATLGDISKMTEEEKERWAFRTLKLLKGKLNRGGSEALVCGFTSCSAGEGRSTWVELLAAAARKEGHQVLVVPNERSSPARAGEKLGLDEPAKPAPARGPAGPSAAARTIQPDGAQMAFPFWGMQRPAAQALIPLPVKPMAPFAFQDWVWDPGQRQRWHGLLQEWNALANVVVLVELPPASSPEAILLAEKLPKMVWLCAKDMAMASETRSHVELLRHSRCELVGAAFNRASVSPLRRRFGHLLGGAAILLGLASQGFTAEPAGTNATVLSASTSRGSLSISLPDQLADWQRRLTLGPGDVLDIYLYEEADSGRSGLFIGPDGRLNYLEARDVEATGLTVDELRKRLEDVLGKYHRFPRVVIRPVAYNSKKYCILGNVQNVGVFSLARPVTIIEAVAKAGGFVTSFQHRNSLVQADLARSFLVRLDADASSKRVAVDFDALFLRGDLKQNVGLAPGDYLFFPPLDLQEVYILGAVNSPGVTAYSQEMTVLGAIVSRGSFAEKAYRGKVLVVRGSLSAPQTFVVDLNAILTARAKDFPLRNKDIVYVSRRPFAKVEEMTEQAIVSFVNGMIWGWVNNRIMPQLPQP